MTRPAPASDRRLDLLDAIVRPLVAEWGAFEVAAAMRRVGIDRVGDVDTSRGARERSIRKPVAKARPSARDYVAKVDIPAERRALVEELAGQFDSKTILPSLADVRLFLAMRGEDAAVIKDRSDAFRRVVRVARAMPKDQLEALILHRSQAGPTKLGPLSDAIRQSSAALRTRTRL